MPLIVFFYSVLQLSGEQLLGPLIDLSGCTLKVQSLGSDIKSHENESLEGPLEL